MSDSEEQNLPGDAALAAAHRAAKQAQDQVMRALGQVHEQVSAVQAEADQPDYMKSALEAAQQAAIDAFQQNQQALRDAQAAMLQNFKGATEAARQQQPPTE